MMITVPDNCILHSMFGIIFMAVFYFLLGSIALMSYKELSKDMSGVAHMMLLVGILCFALAYLSLTQL